MKSKQIAEALAEELFVNGMGERADRLVLWVDGDDRNLGGWCRRAVVTRIAAVVQQEMAALMARVEHVEAQLCAVYWHVTGGALSKPYDFKAVESTIDDHLNDFYGKEAREAEASAEQAEAALAAMTQAREAAEQALRQAGDDRDRWSSAWQGDTAILKADKARLQTALAAAEGELRNRCLCRWESIDGDVLLRHECDGHKQTRLARNGALDRERELRAQVATLEDGKAAFFEHTYAPERAAWQARADAAEQSLAEVCGALEELRAAEEALSVAQAKAFAAQRETGAVSDEVDDAVFDAIVARRDAAVAEREAAAKRVLIARARADAALAKAPAPRRTEVGP